MTAAHDHQATKPYDVSRVLDSCKESKRSTLIKQDNKIKNQVVSLAKTTSAHDQHHQVTKPLSYKESIRSTMVEQESEFRNQIAELHRIYKRQIELMKELQETLIRKSYNEQLEYSMAQERKVHQAAEILVSMSSSPLLWFAKTVTSVKSDADLAFVPKRARTTRVAAVASQQRIAKQMKILNQHDKCQKEKKQNCMKAEPTCMNVKQKASSGGEIRKGKRSKRVPNRNPVCTFIRGGSLCRWR